ncbi:MAG: hypothetical protein VCB42_00570 [Myxococcota bacterium]
MAAGSPELLARPIERVEELRPITPLCGIGRVMDLQRVSRLLGPDLGAWLKFY